MGHRVDVILFGWNQNYQNIYHPVCKMKHPLYQVKTSKQQGSVKFRFYRGITKMLLISGLVCAGWCAAVPMLVSSKTKCSYVRFNVAVTQGCCCISFILSYASFLHLPVGLNRYQAIIFSCTFWALYCTLTIVPQHIY